MKKKVVWLVVSCWMVAVLLLASCAPAVVKEEEEKVAPPVKEEEVVVPKEVVVPEKEANMVKWTGKKLDGTVVEKMIEKPRYGGEHVHVSETQPRTFDDASLGYSGCFGIDTTNEELITRDWTRGPGGTGEWSGQADDFPQIGLMTGLLAESWEMPDAGTLVFHIRQGVHWALDPTSAASRLVGGREFTADDAVFTLRRDFDRKMYSGSRAYYLTDMENRENSIYVSPADKWAVVMKIQPVGMGAVFEACDTSMMIPREVVEKYGDMNDWKNVVGTGPFILKDYVGASSLDYVRNPNYWQHDPFFPENQLPYLDRLKVLIIPDKSTELAALRTGRMDILKKLKPEDAESLLKTNPELERVIVPNSNSELIFFRVDKPELPFYDVRVRQALRMAINYQEIRDVYYKGKAGLSYFPLVDNADHAGMYVPIEEMPESVRELYEYHPDKAKQLLAEAGYPNGFKTECMCSTTDETDLLSLVKDYWAEIGVDLTIDVKEATIKSTMQFRHTFTQMTISSCAAINPFNMAHLRTGYQYNYGNIDDPRVMETYLAMQEAYFDPPKRYQLMKDIVPYIHEQSWWLELPTPDAYTLWQPWLKGYYGTTVLGYKNSYSHPVYVWIDQELKKAMGR